MENLTLSYFQFCVFCVFSRNVAYGGYLHFAYLIRWLRRHLPQNAVAHANSVSIIHNSIAGRYRSVRVADGPITARCRLIKNTSWDMTTLL